MTKRERIADRLLAQAMVREIAWAVDYRRTDISPPNSAYDAKYAAWAIAIASGRASRRRGHRGAA